MSAHQIARKTFLKHCDCDPKEVPACDWYTGHYRSQVAGVVSHFYVHSAIEHVSRKGEECSRGDG